MTNSTDTKLYNNVGFYQKLSISFYVLLGITLAFFFVYNFAITSVIIAGFVVLRSLYLSLSCLVNAKKRYKLARNTFYFTAVINGLALPFYLHAFRLGFADINTKMTLYYSILLGCVMFILSKLVVSLYQQIFHVHVNTSPIGKKVFNANKWIYSIPEKHRPKAKALLSVQQGVHFPNVVCYAYRQRINAALTLLRNNEIDNLYFSGKTEDNTGRLIGRLIFKIETLNSRISDISREKPEASKCAYLKRGDRLSLELRVFDSNTKELQVYPSLFASGRHKVYKFKYKNIPTNKEIIEQRINTDLEMQIVKTT